MFYEIKESINYDRIVEVEVESWTEALQEIRSIDADSGFTETNDSDVYDVWGSVDGEHFRLKVKVAE